MYTKLSSLLGSVSACFPPSPPERLCVGYSQAAVCCPAVPCFLPAAKPYTNKGKTTLIKSCTGVCGCGGVGVVLSGGCLGGLPAGHARHVVLVGD